MGKMYYISADKMAADGFVNGRRARWSGAVGEIIEFAEVVPTIGKLPRGSWSLSEEFSERQGRYIPVGMKTPDMFIGLGGIVSLRHEYTVADAENNGGKAY